MRNTRLLLGFVALLWVLGSCSKARTDEERRATREAEDKAQATSLTSAVLEAGADEEGRREALRSEQLAYRTRLEKALDDLDFDLAKARADTGRGRGRAGHTKELGGRRETLKHHLDALDRSTAQDWAALKATIDRDLQQDESDGR